MWGENQNKALRYWQGGSARASWAMVSKEVIAAKIYQVALRGRSGVCQKTLDMLAKKLYELLPQRQDAASYME